MKYASAFLPYMTSCAIVWAENPQQMRAVLHRVSSRRMTAAPCRRGTDEVVGHQLGIRLHSTNETLCNRL